MLASVPHTSLVAKFGTSREDAKDREREEGIERVSVWREDKREGEWARTQKLEWLLGDGLATPEEAKRPVNLGIKCSPCPICSNERREKEKSMSHGPTSSGRLTLGFSLIVRIDENKKQKETITKTRSFAVRGASYSLILILWRTFRVLLYLHLLLWLHKSGPLRCMVKCSASWVPRWCTHNIQKLIPDSWTLLSLNNGHFCLATELALLFFVTSLTNHYSDPKASIHLTAWLISTFEGQQLCGQSVYKVYEMQRTKRHSRING